MSFDSIEEKNPLKQGLKHNPDNAPGGTVYIEEKNPLKQGLKPYGVFCSTSPPAY